MMRDRVLRVERVRLGDLIPNPKNWKDHPKYQREALDRVMESIGFAGGVLVRETDAGLMLLDGHLRSDQYPEMEVYALVTDVTEDEEDTILLTYDPIAQLAETNAEKLAALRARWDERNHELAKYFEDVEALKVQKKTEPTPDAGAQIDKAEELLKVWNVERGQVWRIGRHRVMCGDSTSAEDVAKLMGGANIELVWTDPPYGVAVGDKNKLLNSIAPANRVTSNLQNDTLDDAGLLAFLSALFDSLIPHCNPGAAFYVAAPAGPLHVIFGQVLKDRGIWRQTIQWVKNNSTFSPMGVDYHWQSEPIFYGWLPNGGHRYYGGRKQTTVWNIDRPLKSPEHPTMKPVELVQRAIENSSRQKEIVYDACTGSGTTIVACEQTGRVGYGMELEPKYVAVTLQRLADMGLTPELVTEKRFSKNGDA